MNDSTTKTNLTAKLESGDEVTITPDGYSVTGTVTENGVIWTTGTGTNSGSITVGSGSTVYPVTYPTTYPVTYPTIPTTYPATSPHFPPSVVPLTFDEPQEEYFEPPRCGKCRTDVSIIQSFVKDDMLIMVFSCHGERRRVDVSLKRFKGNETDAKAYLLEQIDWLFYEEEDWRELTPQMVVTPNADRDAIREWLTA